MTIHSFKSERRKNMLLGAGRDRTLLMKFEQADRL